MGRSEKIDLHAIPVQFIVGHDSKEQFDPIIQIYLRALNELGYGRNRRKNRQRVWTKAATENDEVKHDAS